jgi:hypothetical protein
MIGHVDRLNRLEFIGVQQVGDFKLALFNDPLTCTTFALMEGETIGQAIKRVREQFSKTTISKR